MRRITYTKKVKDADGRARVMCTGCGDGPMPRSSWEKNHAPYCPATIRARDQNARAQHLILPPNPAQLQEQQHNGEEEHPASDQEMVEADEPEEQAGMEEGAAPVNEPLQDGFEDGDWDGGYGAEGQHFQGSQGSSGQGLQEAAQETEAQQQQQQHQQLAGNDHGAASAPEQAAEELAVGEPLGWAGELMIETDTEPSDEDPEDVAALEDAPQGPEIGGGGGGDGSVEGGCVFGGEWDSDEDEEGMGSDQEDEDYNEADRYKPGSAAWRWDQRAHPLWRTSDGSCRLSSLQATYMLMDWRRRHKLKSAAIDELFRALAELLLPPGNLFPPSLYHARKLVSARELVDIERHLCAGGCTCFPPIKRADWRQHAQEACECCGGKRFSAAGQQDAGACSEKLRPERVMYHFGVVHMLRSLFMDPEFAAARREACRGGPHTWRGYPEYHRINAKVGGILDDADASVAVELAADGFQPFAGSQHSSHLVVLRCTDMLPDARGKERFVRVAGLVAGSSTPPSADGMLNTILDEVILFGPGLQGKDLVLQERCRCPDGRGVTVRTLKVRIVLTGGFADMLERQKEARFPGAKAQLACGLCRIQGSLCGTQYLPKGYATPVLHDIPFHPSRLLYTNAEELWVSDRAHRIRGTLVDQGADASLLGCRGTCVIAERLSYVSLGNFFHLPVAHLLLLGLQKSFWTMALTTVPKGQARPPHVLPNATKRELSARCAQIRVTSDFGRGLRDLVKYHRLFTMEEWLQWADCFSSYVTRENLLGSLLNPIWRQLRWVTTFALRAAPDDEENPYNEATLDAFEERMWALAVAIERDLPSRMCTLNLHQAQHIARQARVLGPPSLRTETWMERADKVAKRPSKHSVSRAPEAMVARMLLDSLAVQTLACEPAMLSFHEWLPAYSAAELAGPHYDKRDEHSRGLLLGRGHALRQRERAAGALLVQDYLARESPPGWEGVVVSGGQLSRFTTAQLGGGNIVQSAAHKGSSRTSCYTRMTLLLGSGRHAAVVARVQYFLRVRQEQQRLQGEEEQPRGEEDPPATLRLAVCQVYDEQPSRESMWVARLADTWTDSWAVHLDCLGHPLVTAIPPGSGQLFGMPYYGLSKLT